MDDGNGNVRAMRNIRMELGEPDESGRRRPVPIEGSEYEFETDMVVYAIGTNADAISPTAATVSAATSQATVGASGTARKETDSSRQPVITSVRSAAAFT